MRDALDELMTMRKRGTRPEGPIVITHSQQIASYYRDPNRGMYVVLLGQTEHWSGLSGLDVLLIDWKKDKRHVDVAQAIVSVNPRQFITSLWGSEIVGYARQARTAVVIGEAA